MRAPAVAAALALVLLAPHVHAGKGASRAPLPSIAQTPLATSVRRADKRIEKYRRKYLARAKLGNRPSAAKVKEEAALQEQARALGVEIARSSDTRPILFILEGPDGAGKSGTIRRVKGAFEQLGTKVREVHFGAPPAGEKRHWLARYKAELPKAGETVIWDRSYYGRVVYDPYYGMADTPTVRDRYADIQALEAELERDFRVVKVFLEVDSDRLAQTIGKREALAPEKLQDSDYRTFRDRKMIRKLFRSAIKNTGTAIDWHVVPMSDRDAGRDGVLGVLRDVLAPR